MRERAIKTIDYYSGFFQRWMADSRVKPLLEDFKISEWDPKLQAVFAFFVIEKNWGTNPFRKMMREQKGIVGDYETWVVKVRAMREHLDALRGVNVGSGTDPLEFEGDLS